MNAAQEANDNPKPVATAADRAPLLGFRTMGIVPVKW